MPSTPPPISWTMNLKAARMAIRPIISHDDHVSTNRTAPIRVLLADDHPLGRHGVRYFLEESRRIAVVGEANNGEGAARLIEQVAPDVAMVDLHMPGLGGIELARWAGDKGYATRVLILTAYDDPRYMLAALKGGARGYLVKSAEPDDIVRAVMAVARGEMAFEPAVLAAYRLPANEPVLTPAAPLSRREMEVLGGILNGHPDKIIARNLGITDSTVASHVTSVFRKLQVTNRTQAATRAMALGLVQTRLPAGDPLR
jgi:DNA-binding NarL/FixJ family response regulator